MRKAKRNGFTLMELIVAILLLSILIGIAIPSYVHYIKRSYFTEITQIANRYRLAVTACILSQKGRLSQCGGGKNGVPSNIAEGVGQISAVHVVNGVITVTPKGSNGITRRDTYILTPTYKNNQVSWTASGGACDKRLASMC